jgi:hypothetical protein
MALTSFDILARGWQGQGMTCRNTNLPVADEADWTSRVDWGVGNSLPKPTLAEVEAQRATIEAAYELEQRQARQRDELTNREDRLLSALDVLAAAVDEMQLKLRSQSLTSPLAASTQNQVDTLVARIAQIKAIT